MQNWDKWEDGEQLTTEELGPYLAESKTNAGGKLEISAVKKVLLNMQI